MWLTDMLQMKEMCICSRPLLNSLIVYTNISTLCWSLTCRRVINRLSWQDGWGGSLRPRGKSGKGCSQSNVIEHFFLKNHVTFGKQWMIVARWLWILFLKVMWLLGAKQFIYSFCTITWLLGKTRSQSSCNNHSLLPKSHMIFKKEVFHNIALWTSFTAFTSLSLFVTHL
jgi:hypothetical protein